MDLEQALRDAERRRAGNGAVPQPAEAPEPGAFFSAADLHGRPVPPRRWHVDQLIPAGNVTMLGGDGATGKSLLALQLCVSTVAGRPWLGRECARGGALFFTAEDEVDEMHRRLADITSNEALALSDLGRLTLRSLAGLDALLATPSLKGGTLAATPRFAELEARIGDEAPALAVLDTLGDLHAGNENDRAHARQFVGLLRGIAIRHSCAVLLLAHPSLTGMSSGSGLSGSTAWNAGVRSRLTLERVVHEKEKFEPDPDRRLLTVKKSNYAGLGAEISMTWRRGIFVADAAESGLDRVAASSKAQRIFLKLLRAFAEQGRTVNHAGGQTYAPRVFAEHPDAEGVTRQALKAAMESLLAAGKVVIAEAGPPSKRRQFLAEGHA